MDSSHNIELAIFDRKEYDAKQQLEMDSSDNIEEGLHYDSKLPPVAAQSGKESKKKSDEKSIPSNNEPSLPKKNKMKWFWNHLCGMII
jgi:hypothetical protein